MSDRPKFYITSALPYVNGVPHMGHALEIVQADVVARYRRVLGDDVVFLTGADEHGAKIVRSAEHAGKAPQAFVDDQGQFFLKLLRELGISQDEFVRTSNQSLHWPGVETVWKQLSASGDIYKGSYRGMYCVGHEAFVTEKDLQNGICILHKTEPEAIAEENYFFRLSKYTEQIRKVILSGEFAILPETRKNEALKMLDEAEDVSFSRPAKDISWGVPVPGDATQTVYVWCEALISYISGLGFGSGDENRFARYWPADLQVLGEDILRFHALLWPAMLLSAGLSLPRSLFVHGYITVRGDKMSKTVGNVVDPMLLIEKYGREAARFYFIHEMSTFGDSDVSEEHFARTYDGLLVHGVGNLLARTLKMMSSFSVFPMPANEALMRFPFKSPTVEPEAVEKSVAFETTPPSIWVDRTIYPKYHACMRRYEIGDAIQIIWSLFHALDQYIESYKVYKMTKEDPEGAKIILWHIAYALASAGWMLKPFMPETADNILRTLGVDESSRGPWKEFKATEQIHLFTKIEE